MATHRFIALEKVLNRKPNFNVKEDRVISEYFGENVFDKDAMKEFLSDEAYDHVMDSIENGVRLDRRIADQVASSMKAWAMGKGVTHYTHWFQPLTGRTAEKHDAFFDPVVGGRAIEKFEGDQLAQQEPDASSLPSGGIRNTFEARGYTAWDPTSPAFVIDKTLCIPTVFVSYTGEALDYKAPLLQSLHALDKAAVAVCKYFDRNIKKVSATLGWEQEYFLVDSALYNARPDLQLTGRTLFGHSSSKGQQLDDHYFGSIPERVMAFMQEFEYESHKLGIPVKTRHNEVAPNQYECAPVFENVNLAVDHNQMLMDLMEKIAHKHNFNVLLHEKPFAGMNGNGKHNNWSMATDTGVNLLGPGKNPKSNLRFLTFFINTIKAVHDHADLLRGSIASAGNDHRLGANEAPPAIISVFIGSDLTKILDELETKVKGGKMSPESKTDLKLQIGRIPDILLDNTDRNRTSPFAFTGNKFEFRAVGSTANCSSPMVILNTIMTKQLTQFKKDVDILIKDKKLKKDEAIFQILREYIVASKNIRFEGNGYGDEWVAEAEKRGLSNIKTTPLALDVFSRKETIELFSEFGVLSDVEVEARHEVKLENYKLKIQIESRAMGDLVLSDIIPSALKYQNGLIDGAHKLKEIDSKTFEKLGEARMKIIIEISERVNKIREMVFAMIEERKKANAIENVREQAIAYCDKVVPFFDKIRYNVDKLELILEDEQWPLPKYREMLFTK